MKQLLIYLTCLLIIACGKDDDAARPSSTSVTATVPTSFYGTYSADVNRVSPSSRYIQTWDIVQDSGSAVRVNTHAGNIADSFRVEVNGSALYVPSQTFPSNSLAPGTIIISGTGYYEPPQFTLTINQSLVIGSTQESYAYIVTAIKH
jgi:hypothetical protein